MPQQKITITATFTSEPVEDSLSYWLKQIGLDYSIEFAGYNQVFQELLNPSSLVATNQNGVNVVLVGFEDWQGTKNRLQLTVDDSLKTELFGERLRYSLPNHLEIAHLNQYETEYFYQEIFVDRVYLRHGIVFNEDDCIIDVGANIGLFTLFAQQQSPKGTIYSFEPAPHAFDKLRTNAKLYCSNTHLFNCELGSESREETFTFYPGSSVFSSFAADTEQDEKAIRSVIINMLQRNHSLDEECLERLADEFIKDRLEQETYQVQLRTLSEIIEEYKIKKIDLLKLDAEKSELAILQGIKDHHWSLIKQIVMDVHDQEGSTLQQVLRLLEDKGFRFVVDEESMLHGSGLFNIYATRLNLNHNPIPQEWGQNLAQIEQTVKDFTNALKTATTRSPNPYLVCICPPSPNLDTTWHELHDKLQEQLGTDLQNTNSIYLIKSQDLANIYPVEEYYDPYGEELGHIPYTPSFFAALGTILARKILALKSSPYKVITLDCDNTLWNGVCGEDGVKGVKINAPFRALQEFIIAQQAAGKLICLCSKNQPDDVFAVFEQHPDMLLKRDHLVNWRINWQEKSQNLQSLAEELQLGLDSFIFIDDNPVECAEVRANCPEVLTLQLPQDCETIPQFLQHIWAFDQLQTTQEDQQRTNLYQQNIQRQHLQEESLSFGDFLSQLNLEIEISPMQTEELTRVAQLTQRTNQFNLSTIRRSESQIQQLCNSGELECRVVKVKDRFGDYGLVGLLLFTAKENSLIIDTFLLSCRVLGRGVEHKMLSYLGTIAQERRLKNVELFYKRTQKNQPIRDFLIGIEKGLLEEKEDGVLFEFSAQIVSEIIFSPLSKSDNSEGNEDTNLEKTTAKSDNLEQNTKISLEETTAKSDSLIYRVLNYQFFENIAQNLYNPELILKEITAQQQRQRQSNRVFVSPRTSLEKAIANLFAEVLKLDKIGIDDDFFEIGGDSIQGAILINQLQGKLKEIIHFVVLFETKTVKNLANYLEENYPQAVGKILNKKITKIDNLSQERIDESKVLQLRSLIPAITNAIDPDISKNPPAIFILSPYRSGSTLLRVMLGGNPQLFAPPELELLGFNTLGERKAKFSGRYKFWMEGTIRTIMEIKGCNAEKAIAIMEELEEKNLTSKYFYRLLQEWLGDKILVDKTPSYSLDLEILKRAEVNFHNPLYIHLVRHPLATMRSYEEARVEQIFPYQHPFKRRELAELVWLISHQNIREFLQQIPPQRQYQVKFEDIVNQPQKTIESLCQFLGVEFNPDMLQPYKEKKQRMTDGIYAESRMIGDVKFHNHQNINTNTVDQWKDYYNTDFLGDVTWRLAESFEYPRNNNNIPQVSRKNSTEFQIFPVSFCQQRLWFLEQFEQNSAFYNIPLTLRLVGNLEVGIIEQSLQTIIERHEALRTNFITIEGQLSQIIHPQTNWTLSIVDLQHLPTEEREKAPQQIINQFVQQPFDLATETLIRTTLLTLSETEYILLVCLHHIIADGWSMGVFVKEFATLYDAYTQRQLSPLTPLPIQYADFTVWQRQWLQGDLLETQLAYWQKQLAGATTFLPLPTDKPRPAVQTFVGAHQKFTLSPELSQKLTNLSREQGVTLFMTLFAAFDVLLYRYTGQTDILVGTPIANRNHSEIEGLIGFFVNTLVLRTNLAENPSFEQLLVQVREVALEAYSHQDLPFEMLVEALQPERDISHTPLFQVMFVLQNTPLSTVELTGLSINSVQVETNTAKFDLSLAMENTDAGLVGVWGYSTDLFNPDTIERMTGHFMTLLEGIVTNQQETLAKLPLLTQLEQKKLLIEWNNTQANYPQDKCIHQLFEEQVEKNPDGVAVVFEEKQLTYSQLNAKANQLAHYLRSLGVKTEDLVGIYLTRSPIMFISLLAILKAGGAYVPLDPDYPQARLSFILEDTNLSVLLTQQTLVEKLPANQAQILCLDIETEWQNLGLQSERKIPDQTTADHRAYVLYTSGSTGQPKGVAVPHQAVTRLIFNTNYIQLTSDDKIAQISNTSFDAATFEIWGALLQGGQLVVIPKRIVLSPQDFAKQIDQQEISVLFLTTALFNQLASTIPQAFKKLRYLLFGGEAVNPKWVKKTLQKDPPQRLIHVYGPTESTTFSSWFPIQDVPEGAKTIPIGRPISNTQIYILDVYLNPAPIGVPGELYIGGQGLALGYLNRPQLTEEKFIFNPFNHTQFNRLYKTGDLARYLPNGNIEFLGRIDNQVKIRGFRIELGEIEAILTQNTQVQSSVIIAREDTPGNKRLIAYIVPQKETTPTPKELRQFLKEKLPEYMIPSAFVILESLPLTPNGKIDRRALPAPEQSHERTDKIIAPRNPIEEILVTTWSEVLKVKQVSINDNFFELGGHSLLATQLISRIRTNFSIEIPLRSLFAAATIEELSQQILQLQQQDLTLYAPPILPRGEQSELLLSYAQTRLWFLDQLEPNSAFYNIPVAFRLRGHLNQSALTQSLEEIIQRHEALRTNFITVNGQPTQVIQTGINWTISVINLQHLSPEEQEITAKKLVKEQALQPFDLAKEALVRATLILLNNNEYWLLLCLHHVISDGWSMGVLIEELTRLYNAVNQGQPSPLKPLAIQYADFAIWQRKWLQGEVLEKQLNYWKKQLAEAPTFLPLPTDKPRPAVQKFTGAHQKFQLSLELSQKLTELSQEQGVTMFMTLLAVYGTLLYRYTGESDILIGTPIANRNRREIESLIGFFVNTLVMRTDCSENPSFQELLMRVREMSLGAYSHQDLPFEMLVEALQPERNLSHTPLFQVMFALENTPLSKIELTDLTIDYLPLEGETAKFDLTLSMQNTEMGLMGVWVYNTDLFNSETIERMNGHFVTLLEGIIANPSERISQLPLLTKSEQQKLLIDGHNTKVDYPVDKCIHQLFEEQVEQNPDAVAVVCSGQKLTYNELNCRANQLAHYLQSLGVKPDTLVGICVERSLEMIVGILGILKAGGAYVPLDPEYPQERLSFILEDAQVKVLVTQAKLVESIPEHQAQLICLDTEWEKIAQNIPSNPESGVKTDNLTYIIYTSGSTGKPKGVLVNHSNVVRLLAATDSWYHFNSEDVWTLFHSYAFDFSVWEMWGALLYGGRLIIVPYLVTRSPDSFYQLLCQEKVTILNQTPTAFRQLIQAEQSLKGDISPLLREVGKDSATETDLRLRLVIFGGEALEINSLQPWFDRHGDQCPQLVNMYGITETTVHVTYRPLSMSDLDSTSSVIGRPIPDLQIYLLDKYLQPVPIGVPGEMYVGGAGVTRGYLNRPELTTERFIPSPFENSHPQPPTPKLYKTGDLGRYLPNGELEYLGRIDNQVKIRGFRIELGEIEALLASNPQIWETVVIVSDEATGDKRLVAYIVPQPGLTITIDEIRQFLKAKLPDYMVPNAFVILKTLPLTSNGKIDRRALPPPNLDIEPSDKYVAPRNPIEEILVNIWSEVLKVEKVGINDNFFELGGHSLLATKLVAQIRDRLEIELPLRQLFNSATLAELAQEIEQLKQQKSAPIVPAILPRKRK